MSGGSDETKPIHRDTDRVDTEGSGAGETVKDVCRRHGINDATYYKWKSKYGGLEASDVKRMKEHGGGAVAAKLR